MISILNQQLIMNALYSGIFAGVVAVGATVALERFGGVLGILATIPTTIVPASIGFWLNSDGAGFSGALCRSIGHVAERCLSSRLAMAAK